MAVKMALFLIGFFVLIKGASLLVEGAMSIARRLKIADWIVGITIVGIGTSIPEFGIALASVFGGQSAIGLGTVIGSNTFNLLVIVGLIAIMRPLVLDRRWTVRELLPNIGAIVVAAIFGILPVFGGEFFEISKFEGLFLIGLFVVWMWFAVSRNSLDRKDKYEPSLKVFAVPLSVVMIIAGLGSVILGARWVVDGAGEIAKFLGASDIVVGLTLVGIGTSLPELMVSLVAAYKNNIGISFGNIIGSNIFDFLGILGIAAVSGSMAFPRELMPDIFVTLGSACLLLAAVFIGRRFVIKRWQGALFFLTYIFYLTFIFKFS